MSDQLWVYVPLAVATVVVIGWLGWVVVRSRRTRQPKFPATEEKLRTGIREREGRFK